MSYYHTEGIATVLHGDCLNELRTIPDNSIDAVVTDPPYGLSNTSPAQVADTITRWASGDREYLPTSVGFMGHEWDGFVPPVAVWDECLRVLKPGGHLLAFAGSRTQDLMGLAVRLAGFEIRDSIAWLYGSGFPKSLDVSKAIDRATGAEREVVGHKGGRYSYGFTDSSSAPMGNISPRENGPTNKAASGYITAPATDAAREWEGWGTALKPAHEPIILARKPLSGTVAANVQEHGTGALNIDACRIGTSDKLPAAGGAREMGNQVYGKGLGVSSGRSAELGGRWPANVVLDESQAEELDRQSGHLKTGSWSGKRTSNKMGGSVIYGPSGTRPEAPRAGDEGGASRFFYVAKAPRSERPVVDGTAHPTVKPLALMQWLIRMVTPPGGTVLDPFAGSGTTLEAAVRENVQSIGIEREADYLPLIKQRLERAVAAKDELTGSTPPPPKPKTDDQTALF